MEATENSASRGNHAARLMLHVDLHDADGESQVRLTCPVRPLLAFVYVTAAAVALHQVEARRGGE